MTGRQYKIAIISDYFFPRLGGIESHISDLAYNLTNKGNQVRVITSTSDEKNNKNFPKTFLFQTKYFSYKEKGFIVDRINTKLPFNFPYAFKSDERIKAIIDKSDVVHIHIGVITPFSKRAIKIALEAKKPVVVTWHCVLGALEKYCKLTLDVQQWATQGAIMSAVSSWHAQQLSETFGLPFYVLPNAIDPVFWQNSDKLKENCALLPINKTKENETEVIKIVSSMRFTFRKRILQLIKIIHKVDQRLKIENETAVCEEKNKTKTFKMFIYGTGVLKPLVKMLIKIYNMEDKIFLMGKVSKDDLKKAYRDKDIYVVTCLTESFGIAALEARTAGIAVVGRKNTGISDFIKDNVNGKLATDDENLVENIVELIQNDKLRNQLANNNLKNIPDQIWDKVYEKTIEYYEKAMENQSEQISK